MKRTEASDLFYNEVREKKRTASGVHSKTGKNGYVGKMLFPSDIMSRKDKYNHRKAGKIVTSNIYDTILTKDEFNKLENYEKKNMLQYWRNTYSMTDIKKSMGVSSNTLYAIINELELPIGKRGGYKRRGTTKKEEIQTESQAPSIVADTPINQIIVEGIHLSFNGTYSTEHIQNQLLKFATLLDNEEDPFYIELKIAQKHTTKRE